jgi:hypothetical protein
MNKTIILSALKEAIYLISDEYQSVVDEDLQEKYSEVIEKLNNAIIELGDDNQTI